MYNFMQEFTYKNKKLHTFHFSKNVLTKNLQFLQKIVPRFRKDWTSESPIRITVKMSAIITIKNSHFYIKRSFCFTATTYLFKPIFPRFSFYETFSKQVLRWLKLVMSLLEAHILLSKSHFASVFIGHLTGDQVD